MKIDTTTLALTPKPAEQPVARRAKTAAMDDQVRISGAAQLTGDEAPPIDNARVREIKTAIAEGRFHINPDAIAERLIDTAWELIDAQRKA
ncbi:MAG: flagellar biosynthesis anti-sigma factor FlgM [Zoogloeaceae bacterium]|nr:flagellar biosynthesis anti-sigma factor FlgM [Zoogloeaceae bacterium]